MTLIEQERGLRESISWVIDGIKLSMTEDSRWYATSTAYGGYDRFEATVPARQVRRMGQGAPVVGFRPNGNVLWAGRLANDPSIEDPETALVRGVGLRHLLDNAHDVLFFRENGVKGWTTGDADPFHLASLEKYALERSDGRLAFVLAKGETYNNGNKAVYVRWVPGGNLSYLRFTLRKSVDLTNFELVFSQGWGPKGTLTELGTMALGSSTADGDVITRNLANLGGEGDCLTIALRCKQDVGAAWDKREKVVLQDLSLGGIFQTDQRTGSVADYVATIHELDDDISPRSSITATPLTWDRSHAELMDYLCLLEDWRWEVAESQRRNGAPRLVFEPWSDHPLRIRPTPGGERLESREVFNRVVVGYTTANGAPRSVTADAGPHDDPLARYGVTNTYYFDLGSEVFPTATFAKEVAARLLRQAMVPALQGTIEVQEVLGKYGPSSPYTLRAGDSVKMMNRQGLGPQRVMAVAYSQDGVEADIGQDLNVTRLIARRAIRMERARAA